VRQVGYLQEFSSNVVHTQPVQTYMIKTLDPLWYNQHP